MIALQTKGFSVLLEKAHPQTATVSNAKLGLPVAVLVLEVNLVPVSQHNICWHQEACQSPEFHMCVHVADWLLPIVAMDDFYTRYSLYTHVCSSQGIFTSCCWRSSALLAFSASPSFGKHLQHLVVSSC